MVDPEEIKKKLEEYFEKITTDEENSEQHFDNLHNYLEGIHDLAPEVTDKGFISTLQMILMLTKGISGFRKAVDKYAKENETKLNAIIDRLGKIESEFESMKKGK